MNTSRAKSQFTCCLTLYLKIKQFQPVFQILPNKIATLKNLSTVCQLKIFKSHVENYVSLLKKFTNHGKINEGKCIHGHLVQVGVSSERRVAIKLLLFYLDFRKFDEADAILKVFNGFDLIAWNCMISANVKWGYLAEARRLFDEMPHRNEISWTALISGLMKYGRVNESMWYFERNPYPNVVSWTAAISGCVQNGLYIQALKIFVRLLESNIKPNDVTFISIVRACACLGDFQLGMSVLGLVVKLGFEHHLSVSNSLITLNLRLGEVKLAEKIFDEMEVKDVVSWTAIMDVYIQMDNLSEARRIFNDMPERNEVTWSAMIARYSQSELNIEACELFIQMVKEGYKPNVSCFASVISSLASLAELKNGSSMHAHTLRIRIENDVFVNTSLVDLYCKCGKPEKGRLVFDLAVEKNAALFNSMVGGYSVNGELEKAMELMNQMHDKNKITWNAVISGCIESRRYDEVFEVFHEMILSGLTPDKTTFSSVLCACASLASIGKGKSIHGKIIKYGVPFDIILGTTLTDMYAKSGDIVTAMHIFKQMPEKNEVTWTVMIQGLAENGLAEESLVLFKEMEKSSSFPPNELMLLAVLFACSHCGLVDKGLRYFKSMETIYRLKPNVRHYNCIVDMLSRSGRLGEAEEFIKSMPMKPEANAFAALLSGCSSHKNEEIGESAGKQLMKMGGENNSSGYVLLSNIYASSGKWIDVSNIRMLMREKGLKKHGGYSWIEVRNRVHSFHSEDGNHSQSTEIYDVVDLLRFEMSVLR